MPPTLAFRHMPDYAVFNGLLRSELDLPELAPAPLGQPTWTLRVRSSEAPTALESRLGADRVHGETMVRAYRCPNAVSLVYDDTGRFDVSLDGREITWYAPGSATEEAARADILGRVLPLALHLSGVLCLHASAVAVGGEGIAFLAPKFHGKSSLAAALVEAGGTLITDDVLAIQPDTARYLAGVPALKLWPDSADVLQERSDGAERPRGKVLFAPPSHEGASLASGQLSTAYVLAPAQSLPDDSAATREMMSPVAGAMALVEHARLAPLLTGDEAGRMFLQAATVASRVKVYRLNVVRDLGRLREAASALVAWHGQRASVT